MTKEEENEMLELLQANYILLTEIKQLSAEHVRIAREYKEMIGDPLRKGIWFLVMLRNVIAFLVGIAVTSWGLYQLFGHFFEPRGKP